MSDTKYTLSKFFNIKEQTEESKEQILKSPSFQKIQEKISEKQSQFPLLETFKEKVFILILGQLDRLLNIDIIQDIFADTWSKREELSEYTDAKKYPPNTTVIVPILEHSLETEQNPVIEPKYSGISMGTMELQAEVNFDVEGAILEIRNAKITKIHLGKVFGEGALKFAGVPFLEKDKTELNLPATIDLGEGIPLLKDNQSYEDSAVEDSEVDLYQLLI